MHPNVMKNSFPYKKLKIKFQTEILGAKTTFICRLNFTEKAYLHLITDIIDLYE